MTRERFERIRALAMEMAGEIEWADHPWVPAAMAEESRRLTSEIVRDADFVSCCRQVLDIFFNALAEEYEYLHLPGHQEDELEAAGMVQSAIKRTLVTLFPAFKVIAREPLRCKFARLPEPVMQGPPNVRVPSIAEQCRMRDEGQPFNPYKARKGGPEHG